MSPGTLRAQLRLMERLGDKSRELGTNLHKYADWAAAEMRTQLACQPAEPRRKPRKNCEVLPDLRATGERYQAQLLDLVDQARVEAPRHTPIAIAVHLVEPAAQQGTSARVCSPQPQPAAAGLLAALYARQNRYDDARRVLGGAA